jgi:nucleoside-diphosphate-sugar epimerase
MKQILVTGAQGLVGAHLVPMLAREHCVFALGRSPGNTQENVTPVVVDLGAPLDLALLPERIDAVVHLAQSRNWRDFPGGAADVRAINVDLPLVLIDAARQRGATAFVHASTGSIYAPSSETLTEESPVSASGFYAASKRAAELLLKPYEALMAVTALRFFTVYGPGQRSDMLIPRLIDNVRAGRPVTLQGQSGLVMNPIHAEDAARAVIAALALTTSETINVAGPEEVSIRNICEVAGAKLGNAPNFDVAADAPAPRMVADISRMTDLLGAPTVRFADSVAALL